MISDALIAKVILGIGLTLNVIGFLLWKLVFFEIKGEEFHKSKNREKLTDWAGENILIIGLVTTLIAILYTYGIWFNMLKAMFVLFLFTFVVCIRFCSREIVYKKEQADKYSNERLGF